MSERYRKFVEVSNVVVSDNVKKYDHPSINFDIIVKIKEAIKDCENPLARHALEMIAVKMARLVADPTHLDSWIDIAGYARCGVMVTEPAPQQELPLKKPVDVIDAHPTNPTCMLCGKKSGDCEHTAWKKSPTAPLNNPIIPSDRVQDGRKTT